MIIYDDDVYGAVISWLLLVNTPRSLRFLKKFKLYSFTSYFRVCVFRIEELLQQLDS